MHIEKSPAGVSGRAQGGNKNSGNATSHTAPHNANKKEIRAAVFAWRRGMLNRTDINSTAKVVGTVLADYFNDDYGRAWPSHETIAKAAGIKNDRTVRKALKDLERAGLIRVDERGGGIVKQADGKRRGRTCNYYLLADGWDIGAEPNPDSECQKSEPYPDSPGSYPDSRRQETALTRTHESDNLPKDTSLIESPTVVGEIENPTTNESVAAQESINEEESGDRIPVNPNLSPKENIAGALASRYGVAPGTVRGILNRLADGDRRTISQRCLAGTLTVDGAVTHLSEWLGVRVDDELTIEAQRSKERLQAGRDIWNRGGRDARDE